MPIHWTELAGYYHQSGIAYGTVAFFLYSFLGWVMECIVIRRETGAWENRGFVHSPFCVIYGVGGMLGYVILRPFSHNLVMLYVAGCVIATLFEYLTGIVMLRVFGELWWDYSKKPFNYRGILCLESTLGWGVIAVLMFTFLHRMILAAVHLLSPEAAAAVSGLLVFSYLVDFLFSMRAALRRKEEDTYPEFAFRQ